MYLYVEAIPDSDQIIGYSSEILLQNETPETFKRSAIAYRAPTPDQSDHHPFSAWNRGVLPLTFNCYHFAAGQIPFYAPQPNGNLYIVNGFAPGEKGGAPVSSNCYHDRDQVLAAYRAALIADGLRPLDVDHPSDIRLARGEHALALRLDQDEQCHHFYRRDEESGRWFHKPGWYKPVTDRDDNRQIIHDPRTAAFETIELNFGTSYSYELFGGYYAVPRGGLTRLSAVASCWRPQLKGFVSPGARPALPH